MTLPHEMFEKRGNSERRVCPECLAETPFHRAIWDLRFVAACPIHLKVLVDTCSACRKPLRWRGNDLTRCACLHGDLTRMQAGCTTDNDIRGTKAVYGLLGQVAFRHEADYVRSLMPFRDMTDAAVIEFLCRIGMTILTDGESGFSLRRSGKYLQRFHVALTNGLELAERWPDAFVETLDRMGRRTEATRLIPIPGSAGIIDRWMGKVPYGQGVQLRKALREYRSKPENRPAWLRDPRNPPPKPVVRRHDQELQRILDELDGDE